MSLTLSHEQDVCQAAFSGELTIYTMHESQDALFGLLQHPRVQLDLSALSELDGCGLQLLLLLQAKSAAAGHALRLFGTSPVLDEIGPLIGMSLPPHAED
jgi:anti-anti-sigma factor